MSDSIYGLIVEGFQSLEHVEFPFDGAGFIVIVGDSDVGKSALVRSIKSVANNRVGGDFIHKDSKSATVGIQFGDGHSIVWSKGKAGAEYRLQTEDNSVQKWEKTGRSVPDEIASIVRMGSVDISGEAFSPNIHSQFDTPFLVASTASARARVLGRLSGIDILLRASSEASRLERDAKRKRTQRQSDLDGITDQLDQFQHLPAVKSTLEKVKEDVVEMSAVRGSLEDLNDTLVVRGGLEDHLSTMRELRSKLDGVSLDESEAIAVAERSELLDSALKVRRAMERALAELEGIEQERSLVSLELDKIEICPVCAKPLESAEALV